MREDGWLFGGMSQNGVVFLVLQLRCEQGFLFYYLWILGKSKRIESYPPKRIKSYNFCPLFWTRYL